jgi:hypothetical protein
MKSVSPDGDGGDGYDDDGDTADEGGVDSHS